PCSTNSMSRLIGIIVVPPAWRASSVKRMPVAGSSLMTIWSGSVSEPRSPKPSLGGYLNTRRSSVWVRGRRFPVRMKNGTPAHRPVRAGGAGGGCVLGGRAAGPAVDGWRAVVFPAQMGGGIGGVPGRERGGRRVLKCRRTAAGRRPHRGNRHDLQQVI